MIDDILSRLKKVKPAGADAWKALCPGHQDTNASLSIKVTAAGAVLIHCFAGCDVKKICESMGLTLKDLSPARTKREREILATYDYKAGDGKLLFQVVRFAPKDFRQRRPDGKDGWLWNLGDTPRVLYRLPELLAADPLGWVFIAEGEKDVDAIRGIGGVATCNPGGAGKWGGLADDDILVGRHVCIIADKDIVGKAHAADVQRHLHNRAAAVKVIELPGAKVKDASDWIASLDGHGKAAILEELLNLADRAGGWTEAGDPLEDLRVEIQAEADGQRRPIPMSFVAHLLEMSRATTPGSVLVLAGSPGSAKSYFALNMLVAAAGAGFPAWYQPLESDRAFHLRRLAAIVDGSWRAMADPLKEDAARLAAEVMAAHEMRLRTLAPCVLENPCRPIVEEDGTRRAPNVGGDKILAIVERCSENGGLVIVDPYTMISWQGRDEWRAQDAWIRRLIGIAAETRAVIVVVAHLVKRPDSLKPLTSGDVQGGAALSRLASTILLLERFETCETDVWTPIGHARIEVEHNTRITVAKTRHGEGTGMRVAYTFGKHGPCFIEHGTIASKKKKKPKEEKENAHWANRI